MQKICCKATNLAEKSLVTIRELAAFVGMTNAAKQAIPIAPLFHRHIQALINRVVAQAEQREVKQQYQRIHWKPRQNCCGGPGLPRHTILPH